MKTMRNLKMKMLTILGIVMFTSCSTDDNHITSNNNTPFGMLTSGKWYLESISGYGVIAELNDCQKNSYLILGKNENTLTQSFYDLFNGDCLEIKSEYEYKVEFYPVIEGEDYVSGYIILDNYHGWMLHINKLTPTSLEVQKFNSNTIYTYGK